MLVTRAAEFSLTIERSKFHALLAPLPSPDAMEGLLKARRRDYRKAVHHCWAYRIRPARPSSWDPAPGESKQQTSSWDPASAGFQLLEQSKDDGEVGHPGRVLLELLRKHDLEGVLLVTRIFGGVKLGVGGVSRAFRDAGQGAINTFLAAR